MTRSHRVRPFRSSRIPLYLAGLFLLLPLPVPAQAPDALGQEPTTELTDWSDEVPAHLSVVDGEAWLDRDGVNEAAAENTPLLAGDRLRTGRGRVEVVFADGSSLALDENTSADFLSDTLLGFDRGRIRFRLARAGGASSYRIDAAGTSTVLRAAGDYRVSLGGGADEPDVQLLVMTGLAELTSSGGTTVVRAGYEAVASARTTPSLPYAVSVGNWDTFDRWTDARRDERAGYATTQYLPAEISHYGGLLEQNGDWQYEPTYGYVWYPRVDVEWRPYSVGRWSYFGSFGWMWTGSQRWSWPTHHYGRWGVSGQRYYWIPDRRWAPAWVAWGSAPGYVGWCPLGFDNRPLISINIGYANNWRGWSHAPVRGFSTRVVVVSRGHYPPPRGVHFTSGGYRSPGRPAGLTVANHRGLRGPATAARSSVAVPRGGTRSTTFAAPSRTIGTSRRGESVPTTTRADVQRRGTSPAASEPPTRSRAATGSRIPAGSRTPTASHRPAASGVPAAPRNPAVSRVPTGSRVPAASRNPATSRVPATSPAARQDPGVQRAPAPSGARARRAVPSSAPDAVAPAPGSRPQRIVAPQAGDRRDRRTESEARYGVAPRTQPQRGASPAAPAPATRPAARSRATDAPAPRSGPTSTAPAPRERAAGPSRAPRVESQRPADRPAPSTPARSSEGRATARGRAR